MAEPFFSEAEMLTPATYGGSDDPARATSAEDNFDDSALGSDWITVGQITLPPTLIYYLLAIHAPISPTGVMLRWRWQLAAPDLILDGFAEDELRVNSDTTTATTPTTAYTFSSVPQYVEVAYRIEALEVSLGDPFPEFEVRYAVARFQT